MAKGLPHNTNLYTSLTREVYAITSKILRIPASDFIFVLTSLLTLISISLGVCGADANIYHKEVLWSNWGDVFLPLHDPEGFNSLF